MRGKNFAFTLIELLIVVAIIAILAAIAVPNFLEAQTRSKVSRTKADMRSVATALEAYFTDYNHYPDARNADWHSYFNCRLMQLTTPTAYITTLPVDVFRRFNKAWPSPTDPETATFEYVDKETAVSPPLRGWLVFLRPDYPLFFNQSTRWSMNSPGPDDITDSQKYGTPLDPPREDYDPTNGTISNGDIWRFGP